jgi:hypothetical protein
MLTGATHIIGPIPAARLDPFLLVQSQQGGRAGYVLLLYPHDRFCDMLCIGGAAVTASIRLNRNRRAAIHTDAVRGAMADPAFRSGVVLHLYEADTVLLERFRSTLTLPISVRVGVDLLNRSQVAAQMESAGCVEGILERNEFTRAIPSIELVDIHSAGQMHAWRTKLRHGTLIFYDAGQAAGFDSRSVLPSERPLLLPPACSDPSPPAPTDSVESTVNRPVTPSTRNPAECVVESNANRPVNTSTHGAADRVVESPGGIIASPQQEMVFPPAAAPTPQERAVPGDPLADACRDLLREFRQKAQACLGRKCEAVFLNAVRQTRQSCPDFDPDALRPDTSAAALEFMEAVVKHASALKRSKLRGITGALVAGLYERQYALLDSHHLLDRVEHCYYRMKT